MKSLNSLPSQQAASGLCLHAFNVFRRKAEPDLCCAVPEDEAVPSFLTDEWEFASKVTSLEQAPRGFQEDAARAGVRFNGFYVFQAINGSTRRFLAGP